MIAVQYHHYEKFRASHSTNIYLYTLAPGNLHTWNGEILSVNSGILKWAKTFHLIKLELQAAFLAITLKIKETSGLKEIVHDTSNGKLLVSIKQR